MREAELVGQAIVQGSITLFEHFLVSFLQQWGHLIPKLVERNMTIFEALERIKARWPDHPGLRQGQLLLTIGRSLARASPTLTRRVLTYDQAMRWLREKAPQLARLFEDGRGRLWLERQLGELRRFVLGTRS